MIIQEDPLCDAPLSAVFMVWISLFPEEGEQAVLIFEIIFCLNRLSISAPEFDFFN